MKIIRGENGFRYFDRNGVELTAGDIVLFPEGLWKILYQTSDNRLGVDATNRHWIIAGMAVPCEHGLYPLEETDTVLRLPISDKNAVSWFTELAIALMGKLYINEAGEYDGYTLKLKEIVDDLIFNHRYEGIDALIMSASRRFSTLYSAAVFDSYTTKKQDVKSEKYSKKSHLSDIMNDNKPLFECVYDITLVAGSLMQEGKIDVPDSRELFDTILTLAGNFEADWENWNTTENPPDYMTEIENYAIRMLKEEYGK